MKKHVLEPIFRLQKESTLFYWRIKENDCIRPRKKKMTLEHEKKKIPKFYQFKIG